LTISETLNAQRSTLNLIDNLTGANIDLLPSLRESERRGNPQVAYTFTAKTTDYESRFKLVFSTIDYEDENFAFISNGQIILTGVDACDASLQVIDMLGRVISNRTVTPHSQLLTLPAFTSSASSTATT